LGGAYAAGAVTLVVIVFAAGTAAAAGLAKAAGAADAVSAVHPAAAIAAAVSAVAPIVASFLPCVRAMSVTSFIQESSCLEDASASPDVACLGNETRAPALAA